MSEDDKPTDCDPAGHADAVAAERERYAPEIERLRNAIERLGSMEAFSISRSIRPGVDDELIARIDYARSMLEA